MSTLYEPVGIPSKLTLDVALYGVLAWLTVEHFFSPSGVFVQRRRAARTRGRSVSCAGAHSGGLGPASSLDHRSTTLPSAMSGICSRSIVTGCERTLMLRLTGFHIRPSRDRTAFARGIPRKMRMELKST